MIFFLLQFSRVGSGPENPSPLGAGLGVKFLAPPGMGAGLGTVKRGRIC